MYQRHRALRPVQSLAVALGLALAAAGIGSALAQQGTPSAKASGRAPAEAPRTDGPVGIWIDHTGRGAVEILECGQGLCGRIVWMKDPNDPQGRPLLDKLNGDQRLRNRPICGLQVIGSLQPMRDGSWDRGWIYDPEQGESFDVELRMRAPDVLQVRGYKGFKFLSETFQWRRANALPQPSCPTGRPA